MPLLSCAIGTFPRQPCAQRDYRAGWRIPGGASGLLYNGKRQMVFAATRGNFRVRIRLCNDALFPVGFGGDTKAARVPFSTFSQVTDHPYYCTLVRPLPNSIRWQLIPSSSGRRLPWCTGSGTSYSPLRELSQQIPAVPSFLSNTWCSAGSPNTFAGKFRIHTFITSRESPKLNWELAPILLCRNPLSRKERLRRGPENLAPMKPPFFLSRGGQKRPEPALPSLKESATLISR